MKCKQITFLIIVFVLISSTVLADTTPNGDEGGLTMPTPILKHSSEWTLTENTESDYFDCSYEKNKKNSMLAVCHETATKLNDLPTHFTYCIDENCTETIQLNRKKHKMEDTGLDEDKYGFGRLTKDIETYGKFGDNSVVYEYLNNTVYIYQQIH